MTTLHKHQEASMLDRLGVGLSFLCLVHCLLLPVVLVLFPFLGAAFGDDRIHIILAVLILPVGGFAFWRGYQRHHKRYILSAGVGGLLLVCGFPFLFEVLKVHPAVWLEVLCMIPGSSLVIWGHLRNQKCQCELHS